MEDGASEFSAEERRLLIEIFLPEYASQVAIAKARKIRLAHYTTADTARNILASGKFWMRKSTTMNDFGEVEHGLSGLTAALNDSAEQALRSAIDPLFPAAFDAALNKFRDDALHLFADTYVASFSEHTEREDAFGKLSMWRAYGGDCGVALVLNADAFHSDTDALTVFSGPVYYGDWTGVNGILRMIAYKIGEHSGLIKRLSANQLQNLLYRSMQWIALNTKHLGFKEEKEWRAIYNPSIDVSKGIDVEVEVIRGIPQPIAKVLLQDRPDKGLVGVALPKLIDRLLIGPTQYPYVVKEALVKLLNSAGVENAHQKVHVSNIPLRSSP